MTGRDQEFDAAIMKHIRVTLGLALGLLAFTSTTQPALAQKMFVEQVAPSEPQATPEPELKAVLPLIYSGTLVSSPSGEATDADMFAPLFIDNSNGQIRKSVATEKVLPIDPDEMKGISTYFSSFHPGVDYRANFGTAIHAILPGIVNEIGFDRGGYGRYLVLVHHIDNQTLFSLYAHMKEAEVVLGDEVDAGQIIGKVGLTGHTTGPHLHFELHDSMTAINPLKFFASAARSLLASRPI